MSPGHVFISHASKDDEFVRGLREALESYDIMVWVDSRNLHGGSKLAPEIDEAIEQARQVLVVLSPNTVDSPWVRKEIDKSVEVEKHRLHEGYRVIPLMMPGIEPSALPLWFAEEPVGVRVEIKTVGLSEAMPAILAALGERLSTDPEPPQTAALQTVEELILELSNPKVIAFDGKRRATATARLTYEPADKSIREVESKKRFTFTAPLGVIEAEDMRWYLEEFYLWPIGVFKEQAARVEAQLPKWGQGLYRAALGPQVAQEVLNAWQQASVIGERRFSVFVDSELPDGASDTEQAAAKEAASELLSLPWELLHDGRGFLFHGNNPVRVRRRLPNRHSQRHRPTGLPIRILLVSPRPEEENGVAYLDHRTSAKPLIEAAENLGELAKVAVLVPPTFSALEEALQKAADAGEPFDVIHFDGHGIYDKKHGLGALCFEDPNEVEKLEKRKMDLIHAERLAAVIRDHRIPLVFLEACQTAKTKEDPTASVAAKLLEEGVTSIVAMSHNVLVETAHRFVKVFYQEIAQGKRVGAAMIAGQRELHRDTKRGKVMGAGELHLQDWFVPVLYQEQQDLQLITLLPGKEVLQIQAKQRHLSLGELPELTTHKFQGRSRELLALERLLHRERYAAVRGQGGAGKTTLAVELAQWLVRTNRFRRAAFVSLEQYTDARTVLDSIGRQLVSGYSVAQYSDLKQALQPVERALSDRATIIVLDNMESVLPKVDEEQDTIKVLFDLCQKLLDADLATRIVFTSRESLPALFQREINLGALSRTDAIALVSDVMKREGLTPKAEDPGGDPQEIVDLVEAVNCHARALVLLAREVSRKGVRATTENLHHLMTELDRKHPGDRENSLYASVELSLRRLPVEVREQIKPLAVFHGGAHFFVLQMTLGADAGAARNIGLQLIEAGLAEDRGYGHLRLDPALPPYLMRELNSAEQEEARARWAEAMSQLTAFLYKQRFKDAELSARLTILELPNLIAMLMWIQDKATPERVVDLANSVEALLSKSGRSQAVAQATRSRKQAAQSLGKWSHASYLAESASIDRFLERGDLVTAHTAAQQLLQRCLTSGEVAYADAAYDIAMAHWRLGRVLKVGGAAEAALSSLAEAQQRFQALNDAGDTDAERMASVVITESADCLINLGRWDEATAAYEEAIRRDGKRNDQRGVAVNKGQLGTVHMLQGHFADALEAHAEARAIFESLGEPDMLATAWHQIGLVYKYTRQFEQAERAYRQSLAIRVQQKNLAGEAGSLGELANLYDDMGRLEEAVKCYDQASDICSKLQDQRYEGLIHSNLAFTLVRLHRYDEARTELHRAIECKKPYGHTAELWKTWMILHNLEQATSNTRAAAQARQQAIKTYLAYRRAGGQSRIPSAQLCAFAAQAILQSDTTELEQILDRYSGADAEPWAKVVIPKLQSILQGERDPALADDTNLQFDDAVELILLLEALSK